MLGRIYQVLGAAAFIIFVIGFMYYKKQKQQEKKRTSTALTKLEDKKVKQKWKNLIKSKNSNKPDIEECAICLDEYKEGDEVV